jgi:hypothetical protein
LLAKSSPKKESDEPLKKGRPERHLRALLGDKHKAFFLLGKLLLYQEKERLSSSFASSFLSSILIEVIEEFNNSSLGCRYNWDGEPLLTLGRAKNLGEQMLPLQNCDGDPSPDGSG